MAQDRLIFTAPYVDARTQRLVMTLAAPVKNAQRRIGVIAADLFIDVLVQRVTALRLGEASRAYLVDRAGLYITHPQHEVVLTGTIHQSADAEVFRAFLVADRPSAIYAAAAHYTLISRIPSTGWFLIFHLPYSEVQQPLQTLSLLFRGGRTADVRGVGGDGRPDQPHHHASHPAPGHQCQRHLGRRFHLPARLFRAGTKSAW